MNEPKVDPQRLALRASPRKVARFKRGLLIGIAAVGAIAILGSAWFGLRGVGLRRPLSNFEAFNNGRKPMPDGLTKLPSSYDKVKLGPPLPGELGPAVLAWERRLGVNPGDTRLRPNSEEDAMRAERMRLVQQARQAHEAPIFFQVSNTKPSQTTTLPLTNGNGVSSQGTALLQDATSPALSLDPVKDQNEQGRKLDFVSQKSDKDVYNPHPLQTPASPYELLAGTVIPASLITGINSDLPGLVIAQVTEDIFDSVSGVFLLLPRGSRIIGAYDSVVAFGQSRALIVWQRLIMPNGTSIQIDNLPASDTAGYAGLSDQVDYHTWTLLKGIAMSTLLGVGSQVAFGNSNSNLVEAIRESTQESTNQAGQQIVQKALNIQPTITVQPGWSLVVVVHKDIVLKPYRG